MFLSHSTTLTRIILSTLLTLSLFGAFTVHAAECGRAALFQNDADGLPAAPTLCSDDFKEENGWYMPSEGTVSWSVPEDVVRVAYEVVDTPDREPSTSATSVVDGVTLEADELREGTQYLAVQFKNDIGWGAVAYYQIQIDETAPAISSVTVDDSSGEIVLIFNATDAVSYVAAYDLLIDGTATTTLTAEEVKDGYRIPHITAGNHTIVVTAYDAAGNSSTVTSVLSVPAELAQNSTLFTLATMYKQYVRTHHLIVLLAAIMLGALFFVIRAERDRYNRLAANHARELAAVYKHAEDNFAALRAELYRNYDGIKTTPKKRVTKTAAKKKVAKKATKAATKRSKSAV